MGLELYEAMFFSACITWLHAHQTMQDRINQVRPYLVQLRDLLNTVLEDTAPGTPGA